MKTEKMQKQIESMIPTPQQIVELLDKKLEEAKRLYATANADQKYVLERLFPQLKGSEDERIRKELLEHCRKQADIYNTLHTAKEYCKVQSWVAWLEKQGEQKPTVEEMKTTLRIEYEKGRADVIDEMRKAAWSNEDEHWRQKAIDFMKHPDLIKATPTLAKDTVVWLKALKERYTWKPSDEQMGALLSKLHVLKGGGDKVQGILESLYYDLKKLKE